jgi:hypothetical protein
VCVCVGVAGDCNFANRILASMTFATGENPGIDWRNSAAFSPIGEIPKDALAKVQCQGGTIRQYDLTRSFIWSCGKLEFRRTDFGSRLLAAEGEGGRGQWGWGVCLKWSNILLVVARNPRLKSLRRNFCYPIMYDLVRSDDNRTKNHSHESLMLSRTIRFS